MVKNTLSVMEQNFRQYVNRFIILWKDYVILKKLYRWNLKVCQLKNVLLLPLLIHYSLRTTFPSIRCYQTSNFYLIFKGKRLNQRNTTFTPLNVIIYFTIYELNTWSRELYSDVNLKDCLFGVVKLAENADPDKYVYSDYGIRPFLSLPNFDYCKNVIIFGVDMSSSVHINNIKRYLNSW